MARYHVTLKADLGRGDLFWVCDVDADNEDDAMARAEALFLETLDGARQWAFSEADVEAR